MSLRGVFVLLALVAGCASSAPPSVVPDSARADAGASDAWVMPIGDAAPTCSTGMHACGMGCVNDQPNDPMHGCRFGCGQPCPTPSMGVASCSSTGMCDFTCPSPFHRVGDHCDCVPTTCDAIGYHCGSPDNGCGLALNCGSCDPDAMCIVGNCACMPDTHEPNNSNTRATTEPEMNDAAPGQNATFSDFNLDSATDVDWITFHVHNGATLGYPHVGVRLYNIPAGSDYDLGAWYACDNNNDNTTCATGTSDNMIGRGCVSTLAGIAEENVDLTTNCGGVAGFGDASGTVFIRVTAPTFGGMCSNYLLDIRVR
jgi:hypothetical protein